MKVLITGARGQLGSVLLRTAPAEAEVVALTSDEVDLTNGQLLRSRIFAEAPDILVNAAAYTAVDEAEANEDRALAVNSKAVSVMADAVARMGSKLVHVSTDFVFDGSASRAYHPDDLRAPLNAYGRTKAAGEDHLGDGDLLVRTAWVYAAGGANFVNTMIRLMRECDKVRVVADQIGSPTWATGLAGVIWVLIKKDACGTFHHSDAGVASWYDFAFAIAEEAQALGLIERVPEITPIKTQDFPTPASRPAFSLLDCQATHELLGTEGVHWRTNLRKMLKEELVLG